MKNSFLLILAVFALLSCNGKQQPWAVTEDNSSTLDNPVQAKISFKDITPLFEKHCMSCHESKPPINWRDEETAIEYVKDGKLYNRVWVQKDDPLGMPLLNTSNMTEKERLQIVEWIESILAKSDNSS